MKKKNLLLFFVFLLSPKLIFAQHTDIINSNRPSESMSAFSLGKTVIQLESGLNYIDEKHDVLDYHAKGYFVEFNLRYGFIKEELELVTEMVYQKDEYNTLYNSINRKGLKSTNVGFKYLIYDPFKFKEKKVNIYSWKANHQFDWGQLMPVIALYGGANLNFSNNDFSFNKNEINVISPKFSLITQNIFSSGYVFITNVFVDKISTDSQSIGYLLTLTKNINPKLSYFVENKGVKGTYYSDGIFSTGLAYLANENFQVDFSISKNYKNTPSFLYGGFGVSWRSDTNYKNIVLKGRGEKDKNKGGGKGSKKLRKEKNKKRKLYKELEENNK